jgi:hypothetical protein
VLFIAGAAPGWTLPAFVCYFKNMRRIFLCLLLCFAIPVQGFASLAVSTCHCKNMQHAGMDHAAMQASSDDAAMSDCCKHHHDGAKTCKACKGGQQCHSSIGLQFLGSTPAFLVSVAEQDVWTPRAAPFVPGFDLSTVWRPPALV